MKDRFTELIEQLGTTLNTPLHNDSGDSCVLLIDEKLKVQLELHKDQERVVIAAYITTIDPGTFREQVLAAALKANARDYPSVGIFGYSSHNNGLALFDCLLLEGLQADKLADYLSVFVGKAFEWQQSIDRGTVPIVMSAKNKDQPKPFGL
jgi:hypothetical protein